MTGTIYVVNKDICQLKVESATKGVDIFWSRVVDLEGFISIENKTTR